MLLPPKYFHAAMMPHREESMPLIISCRAADAAAMRATLFCRYTPLLRERCLRRYDVYHCR